MLNYFTNFNINDGMSDSFMAQFLAIAGWSNSRRQESWGGLAENNNPAAPV